MSLPTASATARMRIWRALKASGCVALRDGAYLLPGGGEREQALRELGDECSREGGNAWLMAVAPQSADEVAAYRQLFDRSADYAGLRKSWKAAQRGLSSLAPAELARLRRRLQRELDAVRGVDFFPGDASRRSGSRVARAHASASTPSSRPTSRTRPADACRASTSPTTRGASGRRGGASGSTASPAPG